MGVFLGICPICSDAVFNYQNYSVEEIETLHGDYEVVVGLAYVHEGCIIEEFIYE